MEETTGGFDAQSAATTPASTLGTRRDVWTFDRLAEPWRLLALLCIPAAWLLARRARRRIAWPAISAFRAAPATCASRLAALPVLLRVAACACVATALARPQSVGGTTRTAGRGVAIIAALDQSSSMNTVDFPTDKGPVSRLSAAKTTLARFIEGRPDDLLGLVAFANYPDLACPPTLDHAFLLDVVAALRPARPGDDGTNLGDAVVWSLDALRHAPPPRKVLVLLTDGRDDPAVPHPLDPRAAADLARSLGIRLHTIAVGRPGELARDLEPRTRLPIPADAPGPDLHLLRDLAARGGGQAFEAADQAALEHVFATIDALEKSPVQGTIRTRYDERFTPWVGLALVVFIAERTLAAGRLRRIP